MTQQQKSIIKKTLPLLLLAGVALLATAPFLQGGLYHGSDLGYHLRRIENIAIGLASGIFPVRIQSDWLSGYGYAVGVFYGDALLYFPAALRLLGLPVTWCYTGYLLAINLLTAFGGCYCGRRLGAGRTAATTGAVLYTLSAYRLCNVTTRAALGEYTALAFLPLAAVGLYQCICPPAQKCKIPAWLLLVVGLSGVLQSHLLSFEMTVLCLCLAALVLARHTFTRPALLRIGGAAGVFCLLNAGYLLPLFDYYFTQKIQINQPTGTEPIQANGALWGQLLGLDYTVLADQQQNLVQNMNLTPGAALLLGCLLGVAVCIVCMIRRKKAGLLPLASLLACGALGLWLASNTFPWDALYSLGGAARSLVGSLQFPWRFLGVTTLLMALAVGLTLSMLPHKAVRMVLAALLCLCAAWGTSAQLQAYTQSAAPESYFCGTEEPFWEKSCGHYLPAENGEVDLNDLPPQVIWADGITVDEFEKNGTECMLTAQNTSDVTAEVRLPLLWYKGYTARDTATGERLQVICGDNNAVTVQLPAGYAGTLHIGFAEPWYWRAAELCTLLTALALLGYPVVCKFSRKKL